MADIEQAEIELSYRLIAIGESSRREGEKRMRGTGPEKDREKARLLLTLRSLPFALVQNLTLRQLQVVFRFGLSIETIGKVKRQYEEGGDMKGQEVKVEEVGAQVALEKIARIASKTYPVVGDDESVSEADGLQMIVRELRAYDPKILVRNQKRTLPKQRPLNRV